MKKGARENSDDTVKIKIEEVLKDVGTSLPSAPSDPVSEVLNPRPRMKPEEARKHAPRPDDRRDYLSGKRAVRRTLDKLILLAVLALVAIALYKAVL